VNKKTLEDLELLKEVFTNAAIDFQKESDELFESLPYDDKLKVFCAVVSLLRKGELEDRGSYRHVLYSTFKFGADSYGPAQYAGLLDLHNSIFDLEDLHKVIKKFVESNMDITKDNLDDQINQYLIKKLYY